MNHIKLSKTLKVYTFLFLVVLTVSCNHKETLFQKISSSHSEVHFKNDIIENDSVNQLDIENVYNGGGVGIGDFNRDGLADIFFTGNVVPGKLYLNNGNFRFRDITTGAGINTEEKCRK